MLQDLKVALRSLRRSPGFVIPAVLTLALGLGANLLIFSFVDSVWLRPMAVPRASEVVRLYTSDPGGAGERGDNSYPDYLDLRNDAHTLKGVAALEGRGAFYDDGKLPRLVLAAVVSGNYFDVLGVKPAQGRTISPQELQDPHALPIMISNQFWRREFHAGPAVAGSRIVLDGAQVLITGVLPPEFRGSEPLVVSDVWVPEDTWERLQPGEARRIQARGRRSFELYARLAPHVSVTQARAELETIWTRLAREYPKTNSGRHLSVIPLSSAGGDWSRKVGPLLLAIAGFVLLVACANLTSLVMARSERRRSEIATRIALGARRARILRQLMAESAVVAALACTAALALFGALGAAIPALVPQSQIPLTISFENNSRTLAFAILCAIACIFLSGLGPAVRHSNMRLSAAANRNAASAAGGQFWFRNLLVIGQVAICVVLVVASGLLVRSVYRAYSSDPGFNAHQEMLIANIASATPAQRRELRQRIDQLPGVVSTAVSYRVPFGLSYGGATRKVFLPSDGGALQAEGTTVHYTAVSGRYFETLGTRILRGRAIDAHDIDTGAPVVVINRNMASSLWPGRDALGQHLRLNAAFSDANVPLATEYEVIGIAEDGKYNELNEPQMPYLFVPLAANEDGEVVISIRTATRAESLAGPVQEILRAMMPGVPALEFATMREHFAESIADQRLIARLVGAMGGLGLLLAAVGLYGLMAFLVGSRTQEIGIRMAVGALPRQVFRMILGRALWLAGIGIMVGIFGAFAVTRALQSLLYGVSANDGLSYAISTAVLITVAVAAAWVPALRAARLDPLDALRQE
ncbi:MAG: ABC transporter permease [Acidobacteria bacterium]|nr:ABC transporter permease [Acidobacteriota bacterium]